MTTDNLTYTVNTDGSITVKDDGKNIKYVKESDLGAVKVQLKDKEGEVTKLQTDLAGATTKSDTAHQDVLKERAAKELLEQGAKDGETFKAKVTELETEVAGLKKTGGETDTKLTDRLKAHLQTTYKIDEEKLKDKALTDLENIESTLKLTGVIPAAANYDGKGGSSTGTGDLTGKTPMALATMGYENKK